MRPGFQSGLCSHPSDPIGKVNTFVALIERGHLEFAPGFSGPFAVKQPVVVMRISFFGVLFAYLVLMLFIYCSLFLQ